MPIVIVDKEKDLRGLANRVLLARTSKAATERAIEAIRVANPGLDTSRLSPGTAVFVPDLPQARASSGDVLTPATGDVVDLVRGELDALLRDGELAARTEGAQLQEIAQMFEDPELLKASRTPQLRSVLTQLRKTVEQDIAEAERGPTALGEAVGFWSDELEALHGLLRGNVP